MDGCLSTLGSVMYQRDLLARAIGPLLAAKNDGERNAAEMGLCAVVFEVMTPPPEKQAQVLDLDAWAAKPENKVLLQDGHIYKGGGQ